MGFALDECQREECSVEELARVIFFFLKEKDSDYIGLKNLQTKLCPNSERDNDNYAKKNRPFLRKFHEAIALLKRRGLLMEANRWCCENYFGSEDGGVCLTSMGKESYLDDGILILVDDPYEIVQCLKERIPNIDGVVEQYYLESLRTCQNGNYISSVICLGAASERTIRCLAKALDEYNSYSKVIDSDENISTLTKHLVGGATDVFKSINPRLGGQLKGKLEGLANIYHLNRNEAGHPSEVEQDWERCEQECYLSQFRRLAAICFEAIDALNSASTGS